MEPTKDQSKACTSCAGGSCSLHHPGCHSNRWCWIVGGIIVVVAFSFGYHAGKFKMAWRYGSYYSGMMEDSRPMMRGGMRNDGTGLTWVYGTVTDIEGNKITVLDNGNKERIIYSGSNTRITLGEEDVALGAIAPDQHISAGGQMTTNGELGASVIKISEF